MLLETALVSFIVSALVGGLCGGIAVGLLIYRLWKQESLLRMEAAGRAMILELRMNALNARAAAQAGHRTGPDFAYPLNLLNRRVWDGQIALLAQIFAPNQLDAVMQSYRSLDDIERLVARGRYIPPEVLSRDLHQAAARLEAVERALIDRLSALTRNEWFEKLEKMSDAPLSADADKNAPT